MATDLYLIKDLPKLGSLSISVPSPTVTELTAKISDLIESPTGDEECKTPTSVEHRIPPISSCPPAPRKQRPCKRKLSELQFFEIVRSAEIDDFFKGDISGAAPKKRRVFKRIVS